MITPFSFPAPHFVCLLQLGSVVAGALLLPLVLEVLGSMMPSLLFVFDLLFLLVCTFSVARVILFFPYREWSHCPDKGPPVSSSTSGCACHGGKKQLWKLHALSSLFFHFLPGRKLSFLNTTSQLVLIFVLPRVLFPPRSSLLFAGSTPSPAIQYFSSPPICKKVTRPPPPPPPP